jgi:hypothetical protein
MITPISKDDYSDVKEGLQRLRNLCNRGLKRSNRCYEQMGKNNGQAQEEDS